MAIPLNNKLGKRYKLCDKKTIDHLFDSGTSVKSFPFVLIYKEIEFQDEAPFKIVFSAPKKTYRFANKRNRIKRICREAVRVNKSTLETYLHTKNKNLALFLVYTSSEELKHEQLSIKIDKLFNKLINNIEQDAQKIHR